MIVIFKDLDSVNEEDIINVAIYDIPDKDYKSKWNDYVKKRALEEDIEIQFGKIGIYLTGKSVRNNIPLRSHNKKFTRILDSFFIWLEKTYSIKPLEFTEDLLD